MMLDRDSENSGNGGSERQLSELPVWLAAFSAAAAVVAVGLYFIFRNAAPITTSSVPTPVLQPVRSVSASASTTPLPDQTSSIRPEANHKGPTVYRCVVNGRATYSDAPCRGGTVVDLRPAFEGFRLQGRKAPARVAQPPPSPDAAPPSAATADSEKTKVEARCAWIDAEIARIDLLARQGQSASMQDWLRETRRKLVDEKYALKC